MWRGRTLASARSVSQQAAGHIRKSSSLLSAASSSSLSLRPSALPLPAPRPLPLSLFAAARRNMTTHTNDSQGSAPANKEQPLENGVSALSLSSPTEAAAEVEEAASSFEEAAPSSAPSQPVTYVPFEPTHDWQTVQPNHILPPGLHIRFDFESGLQQARLQPPPPKAEEVKPLPADAEESETSAEQTAQEQEQEEDNKEVSEEAPKEEVEEAEIEEMSSSSAPSASSSASSSSSTTPVTSIPGLVASALPGGKPDPSGRRTLSTKAARILYSHSTATGRSQEGPAPGEILYPHFPEPTPEFLSARAMLPARGPYISVAPMVDVTDKFYRYMLRLISKHTLLYTPMIVDNALLRAPHAYKMFMQHQAMEHPVVAQLGGSEAETMARAAQICEQQGFQQININVGCPAPSASGHAYGACLMSDPSFPQAVRAIVDAVSIPVTIKCRIGLNQNDSYEFFKNFIEQCHTVGGVTRFIIHARKALLNLRSAGKNLTVPPINYEFVYRLKSEMPHLHIEVNGGIDSMDAVAQHLARGIDGVMLGRAAWKTPYIFAEVDQRFFGEKERPLHRKEVVEKYVQFAEQVWQQHEEGLKEYEQKKKEREAQAAAQKEKDHPPSPSSSSVPAPPPRVRHGDKPKDPYAPPHLDKRTLLRSISYLYAGEPGFRRFRQLFEEGMLHANEWSVRYIMERAMSAVEPPPPREWRAKEPGFHFQPHVLKEIEQAKQSRRQQEEEEKQAAAIASRQQEEGEEGEQAGEEQQQQAQL